MVERIAVVEVRVAPCTRGTCVVSAAVRVAVAVAVICCVIAAPAFAQLPPTAWQPVVSNAADAIGHYYTVTQPVNVTGVLVLLPPTDIPSSGTATLSWNPTTDKLTWRGGHAVVVNPAVSASYDLPESVRGPYLIAVVTAGALPATSQSDALTVASAVATAGFGDPERDTAHGSAVFDSDVYVGVENRGTHLSELWRSADGINWVEAAAAGFGQGTCYVGGNCHVDSLIVYDGDLYAGSDAGQIWRTANGTLWTKATSTPGFNQNITDFATFDGELYASQANSGPGGVFASSNGTSWAHVFTFPAPQDEYTEFLQEYDGGLYSDAGDYNGVLGSGPGSIFSSSNGTTWVQSGTDGFGDADNTDVSGLAVFGGDLYAGTFNSAQGAQVWQTSNKGNWIEVATDGFGDADNTIVHQLVVFDGELYAGTEDDTQGGEIWRTPDGRHWSLANVPGFGTGEEMRIRTFFEYQGYLYANGENDCVVDVQPNCVEHGWELWRLP